MKRGRGSVVVSLEKIIFMGQKVNPISLRLEKTNQHWSSCWYGDYNYTAQLMEECALSIYIQNVLHQEKKGNAILCTRRGEQQVQIAFFLPDLSRFFLPGKKVRTPVLFQPYPVTRQDGSTRFGRFSSNETPLQGGRREWGVFTGVFNGTKKIPFFHTSPFGISESVHAKSSALRYLLLSFFATKLARNGGRVFRSVATTDVGVLVNRLNHGKLEKRHGHQKNLYAGESTLNANSTLTGGVELAAGVRKGNLLHKKNSKKMSRDWLRFHMENSLCAQLHYSTKFYFFQCPSTHQNALFLATQVVLSLQERVPFRRIKHQLIQEMSKNPIIKGVRINCSGRVAARSKKAQKAKTESIQWGETSLQVFSELVHFASKSASTVFGKIGVKVWICYAAH